MLIHRLQAKPNPGAGIDTANPMTRGLIMALPLNEGAGTSCYDATGYPVASTFSGSDLTWSSSRDGAGVTFPGGASVQGLTVANESGFAGLTAMSYLFRFYHNGSGGSGKGRLIQRTVGGTQDFVVYYDTVAVAWILGLGTGANGSPAAPSTIGTGFHTVVAVWQASVKQGFWIDGVWYPVTVAGPDAGPTSATAGVTCIGNQNPTTGARAFDGTISLALGWNRAISDVEALQLTANPWQIFESPASYCWRSAAFMAWWASRQNLIGAGVY